LRQRDLAPKRDHSAAVEAQVKSGKNRYGGLVAPSCPAIASATAEALGERRNGDETV
jgi:hypothetical protein